MSRVYFVRCLFIGNNRVPIPSDVLVYKISTLNVVKLISSTKADQRNQPDLIIAGISSRNHEASPLFQVVRKHFQEFEKVYPERAIGRSTVISARYVGQELEVCSNRVEFPYKDGSPAYEYI